MNICTQLHKITSAPFRLSPASPARKTNDASCAKMPDNSIICKDDTSGWSMPYNLLGEEKELALLFLDIRNFTVFMESHPAYDVIYVIRKLFVLFSQTIKKAGGRVIETAGDSIYAVFGLDSDVKEAVQESVIASSAIFHDLEIFNATYAQPYFNLSFEIGVGLHKGNVVVGQYDLELNERMTVMGLPVNIASRLQSETKELNNNLLISEEAYSLLDMHACNPEQRTVHLKGISNPIDVRLLGKPYGLVVANKPVLPENFEYYIAMAG